MRPAVEVVFGGMVGLSRGTSRWAIAAVALASLALTACGDEDRGSGNGGPGFDIENASRHDPPSTGTPFRLPCTDAGELTNFPYFSLGPAFAGLPAVDAVRICRASRSAKQALNDENSVTYIYGTCEIEGDAGCAPPYAVRSYPACQLNYYDYRAPYSVRHPQSKLKRWRNGAVSVKFLDLEKIAVYSGESTIELGRGQGSRADGLAMALRSIRQEPTGSPLAAPARKADGPIGINALPPPAPGALQGKLSCNA